MSTAGQQKTPSAVLAGVRAEGLNSPIITKESTTMIPRAITPAKWAQAKKERARVDLYELAHGTVLELLDVAFRASIDPAELIRLVEEDQL